RTGAWPGPRRVTPHRPGRPDAPDGRLGASVSSRSSWDRDSTWFGPPRSSDADPRDQVYPAFWSAAACRRLSVVGESGVPSEDKATARRRIPKDYELVTMSPDLHWPERLGALYSAVVADVLDRLGRRHQVMASGIRPLAQGMRVAGRALTALAVPEREGAPERPYAGEIQAVDALGPGDVLVASSCDFSLWGELLSTAARARGAHGVVLDG